MTTTPDPEAVNRRLADLLPGMRVDCPTCQGTGQRWAGAMVAWPNLKPGYETCHCKDGKIPAPLLPPLEPSGPWRIDEGRLMAAIEAHGLTVAYLSGAGNGWALGGYPYSKGPDLATAFLQAVGDKEVG